MEKHQRVTLGSQIVSEPSEWYQVVDFLNRTLKDKNIVFGLTKGPEEGSYQITVYEEKEQHLGS